MRRFRTVGVRTLRLNDSGRLGGILEGRKKNPIVWHATARDLRTAGILFPHSSTGILNSVGTFHRNASGGRPVNVGTTKRSVGVECIEN